MHKIDLNIVNLKERSDRRKHLLRQFHNKSEFNVEIVDAIKHQKGAYGLWQTFQKIVAVQHAKKHPFFIFCEDDHLFTKEYSVEYLASAIQQAQDLNADMLSGGVSWFKTGIQISKNLFWLESFTGLQFTVIYKNMYQRILDIDDFDEHDAADLKISSIAERKFVMYPFISIQQDFGYSDVTEANKEEGRVDRLFQETYERLQLLKNVRKFYLPDFKQ